MKLLHQFTIIIYLFLQQRRAKIHQIVINNIGNELVYEDTCKYKGKRKEMIPDQLITFAIKILRMFKYTLSLILIASTLSILQVYSPACAVNRFDKPIEYTLSNFGEIPYGQTLIGLIHLPNSKQLCSTTGQTLITNTDKTTKTVLLVERGGCKFTEKVINAQNLGADIVIIYDHIDSDGPSVVMKNDGHGHLAQIPSLFISNKDGKKLLSTDKNCPTLPVVKVAFEIEQAAVSKVILWLDANNRQSYILARDFYKNDYYRILQNYMQLEVRFRIETTCDDLICSKEDCVGGILTDKFCRNVPKPDQPDIPYVGGRDIIYEELREHFLWEKLKAGNEKAKWWKYMIAFDHQICIEKDDIDDCSMNVMKEVGISEGLIKEIADLTEKTVLSVTKNEPNVLKETAYQSKQLGIYFYPEATINDRNFFGLFKAPEVFEMICDSLLSPPKECITFIKNTHQIDTRDESQGIWGTISLILLVMTVGFVLALFVYTRLIRKEVNQQLSLQVNKMVENYVNLAEKSKSETGNSYGRFDS